MGQQHQSSGGPSAGGGMYLLSLFGIGGIGIGLWRRSRISHILTNCTLYILTIGPPSSRSQQHHSSNTMPNPPSRPSLMGSRYNGGGGPSEYNTTSNSYNSRFVFYSFYYIQLLSFTNPIHSLKQTNSRDRYRDYRTSSAMSSMNKDFDKGEVRNYYLLVNISSHTLY